MITPLRRPLMLFSFDVMAPKILCADADAMPMLLAAAATRCAMLLMRYRRSMLECCLDASSRCRLSLPARRYADMARCRLRAMMMPAAAAMLLRYADFR